MAKIVGYIDESAVKVRVKRSRKLRYSKPLTLKLGDILGPALRKHSLGGTLNDKKIGV